MDKNPGSMRKRNEKRISEQPSALPDNYGETRIIALPRDPLWLYVYWEISEPDFAKIAQLKKGRDEGKFRWILRVHDVTGVDLAKKNPNRSFDIPVSPDSRSWYINCGRTNRVWCVDIGVVTPDGKFILVARSNAVPTPIFGVSPFTDEDWGVAGDEFEKILKLSGKDKIGRSSFDVAHLMRERWERFFNFPSSGTLPGSRPDKRNRPRPGGAQK